MQGLCQAWLMPEITLLPVNTFALRAVHADYIRPIETSVFAHRTTPALEELFGSRTKGDLGA